MKLVALLVATTLAGGCAMPVLQTSPRISNSVAVGSLLWATLELLFSPHAHMARVEQYRIENEVIPKPLPRGPDLPAGVLDRLDEI
jgi:hypothetical protein